MSFVSIKLLSQQAYFCCDKTFIATTICHDEHILLQQKFCCDKLLLSRQTRVCHDKTRLLSQQKYACDKHVFCRDKSFAAASILFVVTKDVCVHACMCLCMCVCVCVCVLARECVCVCERERQGG